ncbi:MAG: hypothetical protein CMJ78_06760 [Planctomycetaceae bacterium]|nr:hypothetical protein [Planctomycetaceae bacterium]
MNDWFAELGGPNSQTTRTWWGNLHNVCRVRVVTVGLRLGVAVAALVLSIILPGCRTTEVNDAQDGVDPAHYHYTALDISYPDVESPVDYAVATTEPPMTLDSEPPDEYWDLSLSDAIRHALSNSQVMKDLGGLVLRSPSAVRTVHDPAIQETDPRFGVAAALSEFDASFGASTFIENNDRALNNQFFGGGTRILEQDAAVVQSQLTKRAATGTELAFKNKTDYDGNNAPGNLFGSAWNTNFETEFRHPFLQGGGVDFNRIAGPTDTPGIYNGVRIARLNTDVSLADFESGVRDFVTNVENAYWDLYFAYRDLDAKIAARDAALETWRRINALAEVGKRGGDVASEAQAREQYFRFKEEVQNALTGRLVEGTRSGSGSGGGTFRATGGVQTAERRLRLIIGVELSDRKAIRPADEPIAARVTFDWDEILIEALTRRVELRKQKWLVKRREFELQASENFLLPTFDLIGKYRWRGFGKDLLPQGNRNKFIVQDLDGDGNIDQNADGTLPVQKSRAALQNLFGGDFQEWQIGFELEIPFGNRRGHAAVRNAELQLARDRAILQAQEREIVHDLSNAVAEMNRAHAIVLTNFNRRQASNEQLQAIRENYENDRRGAPLDLVLDAQRRLAEADAAFYRARVEYTLAVRNVHYEKGSVLDYAQVYLSEGLWPVKAYFDARERQDRIAKPLDYFKLLSKPASVSQGTYPQLLAPTEAEQSGEGEPAVEVPVPAPATDVNAADLRLIELPEPPPIAAPREPNIRSVVVEELAPPTDEVIRTNSTVEATPQPMPIENVESLPQTQPAPKAIPRTLPSQSESGVPIKVDSFDAREPDDGFAPLNPRGAKAVRPSLPTERIQRDAKPAPLPEPLKRLRPKRFPSIPAIEMKTESKSSVDENDPFADESPQ